MGIENKNQIDFISINEDGVCQLTIADSFGWEDEFEHLLLLQDKLNAYLSFLESGEVYASYEQSEGKDFIIIIYFQHDFPESCEQFLNRTSEIIFDAGFQLSFRIGSHGMNKPLPLN